VSLIPTPPLVSELGSDTGSSPSRQIAAACVHVGLPWPSGGGCLRVGTLPTTGCGGSERDAARRATGQAVRITLWRHDASHLFRGTDKHRSKPECKEMRAKKAPWASTRDYPSFRHPSFRHALSGCRETILRADLGIHLKRIVPGFL
jgi:hypothetical protein